jgi:hypothetical protein
MCTCVGAALLLHSGYEAVMAYGVVERLSRCWQARIRVKHCAVSPSWLELDVGTSTLGNSQHTSVSAHSIHNVACKTVHRRTNEFMDLLVLLVPAVLFLPPLSPLHAATASVAAAAAAAAAFVAAGCLCLL